MNRARKERRSSRGVEAEAYQRPSFLVATRPRRAYRLTVSVPPTGVPHAVPDHGMVMRSVCSVAVPERLMAQGG